MADNEIAEGFDDSTYRPGNAVTRQAMAAFMRRLNSEFEVVSVTIPSEVNIADDEFTMSSQCPGSKHALAGGGPSSGNKLMMTDSYPEPADVPGVPDAWSVRWESEDDRIVDPTLTIWILCARRCR